MKKNYLIDYHYNTSIGFFSGRIFSAFPDLNYLDQRFLLAAKESKSVLKLKVNTREIKLSDNFRGGNRDHTHA